MIKIKYVINKYGDYVPLNKVTLELTENQIHKILDCLYEERKVMCYDDYSTFSFGIDKYIVPTLFDCLDSIYEQKKLIKNIK
jgi:hypothetical protein